MRKLKFLFTCLSLLLVCGVTFAQNISVRGQVTDGSTGEVVPFASIQLKGTMTGTSTDADGNYTISVPRNASLVVSSIGYVTQEVAVDGRGVVNVMLSPDREALEEAMVVAYGTARKGTYTGAASVVRSDEIRDMPTTSFENALNGKVAGLMITSSSGQAGAATEVRLRGIGSMNASKEPLYVIDGVPVSSGDIGQMSDYTYATNNIMNTLNPSDIESITVLKDAAASSLYGSRAANGVIMVTTKKGKAGRPTITFKASVGLTPSWATKNYETASVQENAEMLYEIFYDVQESDGEDADYCERYAGWQMNNRFSKHGYAILPKGKGRYDGLDIKTLIGHGDDVKYYFDRSSTGRTAWNRMNNDNWFDATNVNREGKYFDWDDAYFRTAVFQTYDLSVSGGNEYATYYSSFAYTKNQGRVIFNDFNRLSGKVNVNQKIGRHIELTSNVDIARTEQTGFNDTRNTNSNFFMQTRNLLWGMYWPTYFQKVTSKSSAILSVHEVGDPFVDRFGSLAQNMLYYNDQWENSSRTFKVRASETLTVHILDGLDLKSIFSHDNTQVLDHIYYSALHYSGRSDGGSVNEMSTNYKKTVSSTTLSYNKTFGEKHTVGALIGFEAENNRTDFQRASGTNMSTSALHTVKTAGTFDANGYWWGNSMVSLLSRLEYSYDGRYYLSGSFRRDGSSKLGPAARWGNFWSVAGSWRISNEAFLRDSDVISNLRLRASYGVNGTLPGSNNGWRTLASYAYQYNGNPGGALSTAADANLTWEDNYTTNLALEFGLFEDRLTGTVEYYNRDSKNLLQSVPVSYITGFSSTLRNIGQINNHGFEFELGGDIIRSRDLNWNVSLTASTLQSKVVKLYNGEDIEWSDPTGDDSRCNFIYREGESTLAVFGYEWAGVNPDNGATMFYVNNADKEAELLAAGVAYKHYKDGRVVVDCGDDVYAYEECDRVILGDLNPKLFGGINSTLDWKGLSLGLNFIYKLGSKMYDGAEKDVNDGGYYWERIRSKYVYDNRWKTPGQITDVARLRGNDQEAQMVKSSMHLHSGNFLRLKNITLSYNLPKSWLTPVNIHNARLYFSGQNLLTFAAYKEVDPEVNAYGTRGWETPIGKTYTFGVELSF